MATGKWTSAGARGLAEGWGRLQSRSRRQERRCRSQDRDAGGEGGRGETRTRPHGAQAHEVAHASQLRGKLSACLAKHGWARMADQVDIQGGE